MDYRESIVHSYKEMCKVLQRYGYLRRHFETVREFQKALQEALSLDHDSVARLTDLYENADYATTDLDDDHKLNAVSSLRTVIGSLDLQSEQNTR
jgi:predicted RNase H-like nuclease